MGADPSESETLLSTGLQSWSNGYIIYFDAPDEDMEDLGYFYSNMYAHLDGTEWAYYSALPPENWTV